MALFPRFIPTNTPTALLGQEAAPPAKVAKAANADGAPTIEGTDFRNVSDISRGAVLVPPCPADLAERAAIPIEAVGLATDEADAAALGEAGFASSDALADVLKGHVLTELARVEPAATKDAHRLMAVTRAFVASQHFRDAVARGWSLHELFAAHSDAPTRRLDAMGLVVLVALSRLGSRLEAIECDHAKSRAKSGGTLTYRRFVACLENSRPWWECQSLCRPASGKHEAAA